ncbi:SCO family protein [Acidisphaera sp. L21]|uniref:SCO family protein n=1 Tax=Acidisphaera sp. L21 TaxID=1641851 RepID=UPI00131EB11B|nr:SCO family protein [Acidisphaera sp. L21]
MPETKPTRPAPTWRFAPIILAGFAVILLVAAGAIWFFGAPAPLQQAAAIGGPFSLTDGAGKPVTDKTYRGKYMLVYFGYTFCPDVCPTTLNDVAQAIDKIGPVADKLQPLFITIDPARDTPDVIRQYAAAFSPKLQGLTGTAAQIADVAKEYRVYYASHKTGPGPGDYTMDHSSILYVMDPSGHFAGVIRADEGPDAIAADLKKIVS